MPLVYKKFLEVISTIKIKHIYKRMERHSCDNCNRQMPLVLEYEFTDIKGKAFNKITLCEDCANAVANLFCMSMENGESFKYEKDEFIKINNKEIRDARDKNENK